MGPAPAVILVNPQLGENIGTAARAMANFGLNELHIVDPRDGWPNERALKAASGADWIIQSAVIHPIPGGRPKGVSPRLCDDGPPARHGEGGVTPEQAGTDMRARIGAGEKLGAALRPRALGPQQ